MRIVLSGVVPKIRNAIARVSIHFGFGAQGAAGINAGRKGQPCWSNQLAPNLCARSQKESGQSNVLDDCMRILVEDLRIVTVIADEENDSGQDTPQQNANPLYRLSHDFLVAPLSEWLNRNRQSSWRGRSSDRLADLSDAWSRRPSINLLPNFVEFILLWGSSWFAPTGQNETRFLRAAARKHAGRISVAAVATIGFLLMSIVAWRGWSEANRSREAELQAKIDLLLNGPAERVAGEMETLESFGTDADQKIKETSTKANPAQRVRALLYLASASPSSIDELDVDELLKNATPDLFAIFMNVATKEPRMKTAILESATNSGDSVVRTRASILAGYLGDTTGLQTLLKGSNNAVDDQAFMFETLQWRGKSNLWKSLLFEGSSVETQYHAGVVLSTYPEEELAEGSPWDFSPLINSKHVSLHSMGLYLTSLVGQDPFSIEAQPPADANWKMGPLGIPMAKMDPTTIEF